MNLHYDTSDRITIDEMAMAIAHIVAKRSTCLRRQVGAVAVLDNRIMATGYNGAPSGMDHCNRDTCIRIKEHVPSGQQLDKCKAIHAEANLIIQAARHGIVLKGCTVYCTTAPCTSCTKLLLGMGVARIVVAEDYNDDYAKALREEAGVKYEIFERNM